MEHKEVPVEYLEFGMFVAKLDRPWTETPFVYQGFVLKTEQQLEALKKYCKVVYVDPERRQEVVAARLLSLPPGSTRQVIAEQSKEKVRGTVIYKELATVEDELPRARSVFTQTNAIVHTMSRAVVTGNALDGNRARQAVTEITDSVVRNPDAMMLLVTMRDKAEETLNRSTQVSVYMTVFGRFLQLERERLEILGLIGLLQDVGMLKLPAGIPGRRSDLAQEEDAVFKSHVTHSVEILSQTAGLPPELPSLASLHHERYDGSGYPRGLKGGAISQTGAIAGIVDTFDMLTAPAPYGMQMPPSNALNVLFQNRGTQFHAALVEQFIQCVGAFPVGSVVELNSGEVGVVITQNLVKRLQPRVMVVQDANGNPIHPHKVLDLVNEPMATADEPYRIRRTLDQSTVKIDSRELFL
ncbi:MAG TPA: HD domain-containing phosphohydrolase [Burkholderiales bacterium]|nr:HD domain-containing phosphohydrolase [Burkholderiales bacterium]